MDENQKTVRVLDTQAFRTTVVEYFGEDMRIGEVASQCGVPVAVISAILHGRVVSESFVYTISSRMGVDPAQFYRVETWKRVTE